jgi:tape measure domain-containing protein
MNIADILAIRIMLDGVQKVVNDLKAVEKQTEKTSKAAKQMERLGAGFAATGAGISIMAVTSYESLERMRRSFTAFAGEAEGNKLADWMTEFSVKANASGESLRSIAQTWLQFGGSIDQVRPLVQAMEKLQGSTGATADQLQRAGYAIAEIKALGKLEMGSVRQLANAGMPTHMIAKELGVENIRDAVGRSAEEVVPAIIKAMDKMPQRAPMLLQRLANIIEGVNVALAPTGKLISALAAPFVDLAEKATELVTWVNEVTGGWAGLILVIGLVAGGLKMMIGVTSGTVGALRTLTAAALQAAGALRGGAAKPGSSTFIGPMPATQPLMYKLGFWMTRMSMGFMAVLKPMTAFAAAIMGTVIGIEKLAEWLVPGSITSENSVLNPQNWLRAWENFKGALSGDKSKGPDVRGIWHTGYTGPSAERPVRRSSWEAIYDRRHGYSALAQ